MGYLGQGKATSDKKYQSKQESSSFNHCQLAIRTLQLPASLQLLSTAGFHSEMCPPNSAPLVLLRDQVPADPVFKQEEVRAADVPH